MLRRVTCFVYVEKSQNYLREVEGDDIKDSWTIHEVTCDAQEGAHKGHDYIGRVQNLQVL